MVMLSPTNVLAALHESLDAQVADHLAQSEALIGWKSL